MLRVQSPSHVTSIGHLYFFVSPQFKYFQNELDIGAEVARRLRSPTITEQLSEVPGSIPGPGNRNLSRQLDKK